jgi:predicted alpha/beta superfamily hydrolase
MRSPCLGSPSFWYDNKAIFRLENDHAKNNKTMKANVFMYNGSEERTMVDEMLEFDAQLRSRNYAGLTVQSKVLPGLGHHSVFSALLIDGLKSAIPKGKINN